MYHFSSSKSLAQSPECNSVNFMMSRTPITNDLNLARGRSSVADAGESSGWRVFVYVLCQPPMERAWDCSRIKVQKVTSLRHLFVLCFLLCFPLFYHSNSHPLPSTRRWVGAWAGVGVLGIPLCVRQTLYVQTYLQLWLF